MDKQQLLKRLEKAWTAIKESYAGLSDSQMMEPGVMENWSVKDILAHVTTWEEEALKYLPLIIIGGKPPRYIQYGGIDAFNAQMTEQKGSLYGWIPTAITRYMPGRYVNGGSDQSNKGSPGG